MLDQPLEDSVFVVISGRPLAWAPMTVVPHRRCQVSPIDAALNQVGIRGIERQPRRSRAIS
jgi:hypothetical protein